MAPRIRNIRHESTVELRLLAYQVQDKNPYTVGREKKVEEKEKVHSTVPWSTGKEEVAEAPVIR